MPVLKQKSGYITFQLIKQTYRIKNQTQTGCDVGKSNDFQYGNRRIRLLLNLVILTFVDSIYPFFGYKSMYQQKNFVFCYIFAFKFLCKHVLSKSHQSQIWWSLSISVDISLLLIRDKIMLVDDGGIVFSKEH